MAGRAKLSMRPERSTQRRRNSPGRAPFGRAARAARAVAAGALGPWLLLACLEAGFAPAARAQTDTSAVCLTSATEVQEVPIDWPLVPRDPDIVDVGVFPGSEGGTPAPVTYNSGKQGTFRLLFVTSRVHSARSGDIGFYNDFVRAEAARGHPALRPYADHFCVLGSTSAVDAKQNTRTDNNNSNHYGSTGGPNNPSRGFNRYTPVYWLDRDPGGFGRGTFISGDGDNWRASPTMVANNNIQLHRQNGGPPDLWANRWMPPGGSNPRNRDGFIFSQSERAAMMVYTGTESQGGFGRDDSELGQDNVNWGRPGAGPFLFESRTGSTVPNSQQHRFYALSGVFKVVPRNDVARVSMSVSAAEVPETYPDDHMTANLRGQPGTVTITVTADRQNSSGALQVPIVVRRNASTATLCATGATNCDYSLVADPVDDDDPKDFSASTGIVTIPSGETTGTLRLAVVPDERDEPDETAVVAIGRPLRTGATNMSVPWVPDWGSGKSTEAAIEIKDSNVSQVSLANGEFAERAEEGNAQDKADILVTFNRRMVAGESLTVPLKFEWWDRRGGTDDDGDPDGSGAFVEAVDAASGLARFSLALDGSPQGATFDSQALELEFSGPMPPPGSTEPDSYSVRLVVTPREDDDADTEFFRVSAATSTLEGVETFSGGVLGDNGCRTNFVDTTADLPAEGTDDRRLCDENIFGFAIDDDEERGVLFDRDELMLIEGGVAADGTAQNDTAIYKVALTSDPGPNTTVEILPVSGDGGAVVFSTALNVDDPATTDENEARNFPDSPGTDPLRFTGGGYTGTMGAFVAGNWATPQSVIVRAADDPDSRDETVLLGHTVTVSRTDASAGHAGHATRDPYNNVTPDAVTVAVADDDPVANFSVAAASVGEGGGSTATTVRIDLSSPALTEFGIHYRLTGAATLRDDYNVLYFPGGDSEGGTVQPDAVDASNPDNNGEGEAVVAVGKDFVEFQVTTIDDTDPEPDEDTIVNMVNTGDSGGDGYTVGAVRAQTVTIKDNDTPEFTVNAVDARVTEGGEMTFRISHANADLPLANRTVVTVRVGDDPRAGGYSDFIDNRNSPPGGPITPDGFSVVSTDAQGDHRVVFDPGVAFVDLKVQTVADDDDEPSGEVSLTILEGDGYNARSPSSVAIPVDDDDTTVVTLRVVDGDAAEGDPGETATIRLVLGRPLLDGEILGVPLIVDGAALGINFTLALEGPPTGVAYDADSATVTFTGPPSGTTASTAVLTLTAVDDVDQASEMIEVSIPESDSGTAPTLAATGLAGGAAGQRTGDGRIDITDDDVPGVTVSPLKLTVGEGGAAGEYTVVLDAAPAATVEVAMQSGDRDKVSVPSVPLLFTADDWDEPKTVTVMPVDDLDSDDEIVEISHAVTGYFTVIDADPVEVTVRDDDPAAFFSAARSRVDEGGGTFDVTVNLRPAPPVDMFVHYALVSTESTAAQGGDWSIDGLPGAEGSLEVEAGARSVTIPLTIIDDEIAEGGETVVLELTGPTPTDLHYTLGEVSETVITIADNDVPEITIQAKTDEVAEDSATSAVFIVTSSYIPENPLEVLLLVDETRDFVHPADEGNKSVTIPPGESSAEYAVPIVDDRNDEPDGRVTVAVRAGTEYIGTPRSSMETVDDDPTTVSLTVRDDEADEDNPNNKARITVGLDRGLVAGEELSVPLLFEGGSPQSDFVLELIGLPTGVEFSGSTITFSGPESGESAELVGLTLTAEDDSDADSEAVAVSVPLSSEVDPPRLDATTLSGGAVGRVLGEGVVNIRDNDISGVSVSPTFLRLNEMEAGEYTIVLATDPGQEVSIVATPSVASKVTVQPGSLRFTSGNWETPQTVTVTALNDSDSDDEALTVEHRVVGYGDVQVADAVSVQVRDDDPEVAFTRAASRAGENFGSVDVTIGLSPAPAEGIEVRYRVSGSATPAVDADGSGDAAGDFSIDGLECLDGSGLKCVANTPEADRSYFGTVDVARGASAATVSVVVLNDDNAEASESVLLTLIPLEGADTKYTVGGARTYTLTLVDDDSAGVVVTPLRLTLTEGVDGEYSLSLSSSPVGNVTVTPSSSDEGAVTISPGALTFTPGDWDEPQTVTVTPAHDADSRNEQVLITHTVAGYGSVTAANGVLVSVTDDDPRVSFARSASTAGEDAGTFDVEIALTRAAEEALTLTWCLDAASTAEPGEAADGGDYTVATPLAGNNPDCRAGDMAGMAEVASGSSSAAISFTIADDLVAEGSETVVLTLPDVDVGGGGAAGPGYSVSGTRRHVLTIADNDRGGVIVTPTELDLEEGESGSYTVVLTSDPGGAATVSISSGDPRAVALSTQALIFTSLDWDQPQTVIVSARHDDDEDDEAATVFHDVEGYFGVTGVAPVEVTVTDDDGGPPPSAATVSIQAGGDIEEGQAATFTLIAAPAPSAQFTVNVTVADAAGVAGPGQTGSRPVSIGTGGTGTLTVATVDDDTESADARIVATLGDGPGYTVGAANQAEVLVRDNDAAPPAVIPEAAFAAASGGAGETGADGVIHEVEIAVDPAPAASTALNYVLSGSARLGEDYRIDGVVPGTGAGAVAVPAGAASAVIVVEIIDDRVAEEEESAVFTLTGGADYTVGAVSEYTLTLTDDDTPGVTVTPAEATVDEGASADAYTLVLDTDPGRAVTVTPSSSDPGAATVSGALIFDSRNWDRPQTVTVSALEDADADNETVTIAHSVAGYAGVAAAGEVTVSVVDDEAAASVVSIAGGGAVEEGELAVFRLSASPPPPGDVIVNVVVADPAGRSDAGQSGNRPVTLGVSGAAMLTVATAEDDIEAPDGTLTATVAPGQGYTVAAEPGHTAAVDVRDDDAPPVSTVPLASFSPGNPSRVTEPNRAPESMLSVEIALGPVSSEALTLGYEVVPESSTAASGQDYCIAEPSGEDCVLAGTVEVPAGAGSAAILLAVVNDDRDEPDETLVLVLTEPGGDGYELGDPARYTLTIVDNDEPPPLAEQAAPSLARLGRSLTGHLLDSVALRLSGSPSGALAPPTMAGGPFSLRVAGRDHGEWLDRLDRWSDWLAGWRGEGRGGGAFGLPAGGGGLRAWLPVGGSPGGLRGGAGTPGAGLGAMPEMPGLPGFSGGGGAGTRPGGGFGSGGWPGMPGSGGTGGGAWPGGFAVGARPPQGGSGAGGVPGLSGGPILGATGGVHVLTSGAGLGAGSRFPGFPSYEIDLDGMLRGAIAGSSFLGLGPRLAGGRFGFWGRGTESRFAGDDREGYSIDGEMTSMQLGADWTRVWLTLGVMVSSGSGEGRYGSGTVVGDVGLTLNSVTPYLGYELGERSSIWAALSVSEGEMTIQPDQGEERVADLTVSSISGGGRGEIFAGSGGVLSLSVISDLSLMRAETAGEAELDGVAADSGRLRLALESAWTFSMPAGGAVSGRLEAGLRGDAGDGAEGFGAELAAGVSVSGAGLTLDLQARGLAVHQEEALRQQGVSLLLSWDPVRDDPLGPVASLSQGWGADTAGSVDRLYGTDDLENFAGGHGFGASGDSGPGRLDLELGWGLPWHRELYVLTPSLTYGDHGHGRNAGAGWRLVPSRHNRTEFTASLRAVWRERTGYGAFGPYGAGGGYGAAGGYGAGFGSYGQPDAMVRAGGSSSGGGLAVGGKGFSVGGVGSSGGGGLSAGGAGGRLSGGGAAMGGTPSAGYGAALPGAASGIAGWGDALPMGGAWPTEPGRPVDRTVEFTFQLRW